jgi:hypothetical protein
MSAVAMSSLCTDANTRITAKTVNAAVYDAARSVTVYCALITVTRT